MIDASPAVATAMCLANGCKVPIQVGRVCCDRHWQPVCSATKERFARAKSAYDRAMESLISELETLSVDAEEKPCDGDGQSIGRLCEKIPPMSLCLTASEALLVVECAIAAAEARNAPPVGVALARMLGTKVMQAFPQRYRAYLEEMYGHRLGQ